MIIRRFFIFSLVLLICEMSIFQPVFAQQAAEKFGLKIKIENGDGASTAVKLPSTEPLVVVVVDANDRPVDGALVVFTAPEEGSGGVFENGTRSMTVSTDRNGRASASGYRANATPGTYQIEIQTQLLNETATATVTHTNTGAAKKNTKMIAILAIAGAGAAGAILASSGGKGGSSTTTPGTTTPTVPTITFGGATVGAP